MNHLTPFKERARLLIQAAESLATDLEKNRIPNKRLGKRVAFHENGATGCALGHVLHRAGARPLLAPFRGPTFDGSIGARWWSGELAVWELLKKTPMKDCGADGETVMSLLRNVQFENDAPGKDRMRKTARALRLLVEELRKW